MRLWPPCRKFLVKFLKNFCWSSRIYENLISFPRNLLVKRFIWTYTTKFWQACHNNAAKNTGNVFLAKSQKDGKAFFSEKSKFFLQFLPSKNKKIFISTRRIQLWPPCQKLSRQNSENLLLEFRRIWKICAFSQQSFFSPNRLSNMYQEILKSLP